MLCRKELDVNACTKSRKGIVGPLFAPLMHSRKVVGLAMASSNITSSHG